MRGEGQGRCLVAEFARARLGGLDHGAMPAMNAIEIADRHHGAGERPGVDALRTAAHNMELSCRHTGLVHRFSDRLKQKVVINLHMFSSGRAFDAVTVSAPLTNLQINGLFKARCYLSPPSGESPLRAHARWPSI